MTRSACSTPLSLGNDGFTLIEMLVALGVVALVASLGIPYLVHRADPGLDRLTRQLAAELRHALVVEDMRKIDRWTARHGIAEAIWPVEPYDPFFNANRPEDLAEAEAILGRHPEA